MKIWSGLRGAAAVIGGVSSLALAPSIARADTPTIGATGIITDRPCTNTPGQSCVTGARDYAGETGGFVSSTSASAALPGGGTASYDVSFNGGYLPVIKLGSQAGASTRVGSSASGWQLLTYTGSQSIDLALNGALHYFTSGDATAGDGAGEGSMYAFFSILAPSALAGYDSSTSLDTQINNSAFNFAHCSDGAIGWSDYSSLGQSAGEYTANLGLSTGCNGGAITLHPGDQFIVVASLQAISNQGGFTDATHTFNVQYDLNNTVFTDTGQKVGASFLQEAITGVPEPSTWALMLLGFGGIGLALRRRGQRGKAELERA